jgi:hypothetical protein
MVMKDKDKVPSDYSFVDDRPGQQYHEAPEAEAI